MTQRNVLLLNQQGMKHLPEVVGARRKQRFLFW
jgi:hypothetical protein